MIHIDNVHFLRKHYPEIWAKIRDIENRAREDKVQTVQAKKGTLTICINYGGKQAYLHSQYDPLHEAERYINKYKNVEDYEHVFFYGLGLGYHVKVLLDQYPHLSFTLYEPQPDIMLQLLTHQKLEEHPVNRLKHIFVETSESDKFRFLSTFANQMDGKVLLVVWPAYERLFKEQWQQFLHDFKEHVSQKRSALHTNIAFEKRWTINSMINLKHTLKTPNILHDVQKKHFKGKPAMLVAAGPSLQKEFDHLKQIKERGLAYIFSVGSAINALIEHGITPHAACTYDPSVKNQIVFERLKEQQIDTVPLIYGTSVGYETLQNYPGAMLHMITSQDTVSPFYLNHGADTALDFVRDAPSIAVVTLELLYKLGCNPIILVGQDLAYPDRQRYAKGIEYDHVSSNISDDEVSRNGYQYVEDVHGNPVLTRESFIRMRKQLEKYIEALPDLEVINTSQGGAKIEGATFKPLCEVIAEYLTEKNIVSPDWWKAKPQYDYKYIVIQQNKMEKAFSDFQSLKADLDKCLQQIHGDVQQHQISRLERLYKRLEKGFKRLLRNDFYSVFLKPVLRVQAEILNRKVMQVKFEQDVIKKGNIIYQSFVQYLNQLEQDLNNLIPLFKKMHSELDEIVHSARYKPEEVKQ